MHWALITQCSPQELCIWLMISILILAWAFKGLSLGKANAPQASTNDVSSTSTGLDINEHLEATGNQCIAFFGTQTGTAETLALEFVLECKARLNMNATTGDIATFDMESLSRVESNKFVALFLATYGDGEPTDNAIALSKFFADKDTKSGPLLPCLRYAIFGLGNKNYEFYNAMARNTDSGLTGMGAHRVGVLGEGDEAEGTTDDSFAKWKTEILALMAESLGLKQSDASTAPRPPAISVSRVPGLNSSSEEVAMGEHQAVPGRNGPGHIALVPLKLSRKLTQFGERDYLHLEFDVAADNIHYETGDHLVIWPTNSNLEVDRFLRVFGLHGCEDTVISITAEHVSAMRSFPSLTTCGALARYYLDICGPVKKRTLRLMLPYAPNAAAATELAKLIGDTNCFNVKVTKPARTIAQVLENISGKKPWTNCPLGLLVDELAELKPRSYSISSSALEEPSRITITVVVEKKTSQLYSEPFLGTCTNYLKTVSMAWMGSGHTHTHDLDGPRSTHSGLKIPVQIKSSSFKLPADPSKPVIMIGAGTGVAPFRGFIRERALQHEKHMTLGQTMLFFGCRSHCEDYLYEDEWKALQQCMGHKLEVTAAFSRDQESKVYVQHRVQQDSKAIIRQLALDAHVYVCGEAANMAKGVREAFLQIFQEGLKKDRAGAEMHLKLMKKAHRYQASFPSLSHLVSLLTFAQEDIW